MSPIPGYGMDLPEELILGYLSWWTVTEPQVTHAEMVEMCTELQLDMAIIPGPPRKGDAFKRACRYSERKGIAIPGSDNTANFLIRPVTQNATEVERHMVLEIVDPDGRKLEYHDAAKMRFDRSNNVLHVKKKLISDELDLLVADSLDRFQVNFEHATKYLDAQVIRRMIRSQLERMRAIGVRPQGSIYFYPKAEKDKGNALEELCRRLSHGTVFHSLPLIDNTKQREMVKAAFEEDVHQKATQIIAELNQFKDSKTQITARAWKEYRDSFNTIVSQHSSYSELVSTELDKASIEIAALEQHLGDFLVEGLVKT